MAKKVSAFFIICSILLTFTFTAYGAPANALEGSCGANAFWSVNLSEGTLTISGSGAMQNYTESNFTPWKAYISSIKTINIADGITTIGAFAFPWCEEVKEIVLPQSVVSIGKGAFGWCSGLERVVLPSNLQSIGENAFVWCKALKDISIPASVSSIEKGAFAWCAEMTAFSVDASNQHYTVQDGVLFNKEKTALVAYPYGRTDGEYIAPEGVTSIGDSAFISCTNLYTVYLPASLEVIDRNAFSGCKSLSKVSIPGVKQINDSAFYGCSNLREILLPSGLERIGEGAFRNCTSLIYMTIPESVTKIGANAFQGDSELTVSCYLHSAASNYAAANGITFTDIIRVYYNGTEIVFDQKPFVKNNRTLVPMRAIFETLGAEVSWDGDTHTALAKKGATSLHIQIGSNILYKDGTGIPLDEPAQIMGDRTLVPLRAVSEAFDVVVEWDGANQIVRLTSR